LNAKENEEFRDFMTSRWPRLLRTAFLLVGGNHHDAEDLTQSTLARVYAKWDHVQRSEHIDGYVRQVMVHLHTDRFRRRRIREWITARVPDAPVSDRGTGLDERDVLVEALSRLPARQRAAVVLCYFEGMSQIEIATTLGVSVGTAKSQVSRGLEKLRRDNALKDLRSPDTMPPKGA
jgi:RNA polymerase sigma-70 factor (sigma-E family)